ncbi:kinase-associated lipoprotein B [Caldalkalibacillus salinus]|uniref:kinase-associated lipoprotein B n=1 Tax=Caldalkalibacillus salinus TaxID=2803787 RepID=UPI00192302F5|nr:kinase-associated lipoprotein B [Caldalkalibacillus salinus]
MSTFEVGTVVQAVYKTGVYVGEIIEVRSSKAVVKILAVLKHPTQGDLHQPYQANVDMFHQRKALAYQEKALVPHPHLRTFSGDTPAYEASLAKAVDEEIEALQQRDDQWAQQCVHQLEALKKEYFPKP